MIKFEVGKGYSVVSNGIVVGFIEIIKRNKNIITYKDDSGDLEIRRCGVNENVEFIRGFNYFISAK